jgi:hypothetical protein
MTISNSKSVMKPFILPLISKAEKKMILLCEMRKKLQITNIHLLQVLLAPSFT